MENPFRERRDCLVCGSVVLDRVERLGGNSFDDAKQDAGRSYDLGRSEIPDVDEKFDDAKLDEVEKVLEGKVGDAACQGVENVESVEAALSERPRHFRQ